MRLCVSTIRLKFRVNAGDKRRVLGQAANTFFSITVYGWRFRVAREPDVKFFVFSYLRVRVKHGMKETSCSSALRKSVCVIRSL
jgi:hypothetical protein